MNLLDQMKMTCAKANDIVRAIAEQGGAEARVTMIVSHPGTAEDSFMVGQHEFPELYAILARLETDTRAECDVTSTSVGEVEIVKPAGIQ